MFRFNNTLMLCIYFFVTILAITFLQDSRYKHPHYLTPTITIKANEKIVSFPARLVMLNE